MNFGSLSTYILKTEITMRIWANKIIADSLFAGGWRHKMSMTFATFLSVTISGLQELRGLNQAGKRERLR